jgi:hypothetical protein
VIFFRDARYAVMCDTPGCSEWATTGVSTDVADPGELPMPVGWQALVVDDVKPTRGELVIKPGREVHACPLHPVHVLPGQRVRATVTLS